MDMNSNQFSEIMKDLAEITGKQITDRTVKTYWNYLFKVDASRIRDAFKVFAAKSQWATINEWLQECGYRQQEARNEREHESSEKQIIEVQTKKPEEESGEMTWMFEVETESEVQADIVFAAKERELLSKGWTVREARTNKARTRPENKMPSKTVFVRFWDCIKIKGYKPSSSFKTVQEGMAAIKELIGSKLAEKLIPQADAYENWEF